MKERFEVIASAIKPCGVLADIGCDHGYVTQLAINKNISEKYIISDVSEKCLNKAKRLLEKEIECGKVTDVVSDGFNNIEFCDEAVIAGMGGEEMIKIIGNSSFLPKYLVLQPMKNSPVLRRFIVEKGYKILSDFTFKAEKKFYVLIVAELGEDTLTEDEEMFGRTNVSERGAAFIEETRIKIKNIKGYVKRNNISDAEKERLSGILEGLKKYV